MSKLLIGLICLLSSSAFAQGVCAMGAGTNFSNGMVGCPGVVTWDQRQNLCAPGARVATAREWDLYKGATVPAHNYWTDDNLKYDGQGPNSCFVDTERGQACPANQPMRVCVPGGSDALGNKCNWTGCNLTGSMSTPFYFGGCAGNATAGTLCISPCADGSVEQSFTNGLVGCSGRVTWDQAPNLCGPGYRLATAAEWDVWHGPTAPTFHYWTSDALKWGGAGSGSCWVSTTNGNPCPANEPMRVCTAASNDPLNNSCNWRGCNLEGSMSTPFFFGGCAGNSTAGALCVKI
jgi:hypothetical protein